MIKYECNGCGVDITSKNKRVLTIERRDGNSGGRPLPDEAWDLCMNCSLIIMHAVRSVHTDAEHADTSASLHAFHEAYDINPAIAERPKQL